jgi:hypothetical protein
MSAPPPEPVRQPEPNPPADERPDWLVGAEDGVQSEFNRDRQSAPAPEVKLSRPAPPDGAVPPPESVPPAPRRSGGVDAGSADYMALDLTDSAPGAGTAPAASESLKLSDRKPAGVPGRATGAAAAPAKPEAWKAAASSVPKLRRESARVIPFPPAVRTQEPEEDAPEALDFPEDSGPAMAVAPPSPGGPRPREAWWAVAMDEITTNRRIQLLVGLLLAAILLAVWILQPRNPGVAIGEIRKHPERWDNRGVTVSGKVGEVFPLGGGHAFYLHQGRDTLVVFTRSGAPQARKRVTVTGTIQTGYLDGQPRQSLFADL